VGSLLGGERYCAGGGKVWRRKSLELRNSAETWLRGAKPLERDRFLFATYQKGEKKFLENISPGVSRSRLESIPDKRSISKSSMRPGLEIAITERKKSTLLARSEKPSIMAKGKRWNPLREGGTERRLKKGFKF